MNLIMNVLNSFFVSIVVTIGLEMVSWSNLTPLILQSGLWGTWVGVFGYLLVITSFVTAIKCATQDFEFNLQDYK